MIRAGAKAPAFLFFAENVKKGVDIWCTICYNNIVRRGKGNRSPPNERKRAMITITGGTEKQNALANDIIRRPIAGVEKNIARTMEDVAIHKEKFGCDLIDAERIPILRRAIELYEQTMELNAQELTAAFVIENYRDYNMFVRTMWACLEAAFRDAGYENVESVCNFACP